jgi:hypothetical protein
VSTCAKSTARIVWAWAAEKLSPGRTGPQRGGIDADVLQDLPDGGGGHPVAEADQLTVNASVAPAGILAGHPQHQCPDGLWGGWAARSLGWVGPAAGNEVGVPAQQSPRRDKPQPAQVRGQQLAQRAEKRSVDPGHRGARIASSKYGDLVAEHQDLDVLGCVGSGEQRQPTQHAGEHQVCESKSHGERSCWAACER